MLIQVSVSDGFHHQAIHEKHFQMDIDPNQSVENLKVLITLRFVDLGPNDFNLVCMANNQVLANQQLVHQIIRMDDQIHVQITNVGSSVCSLI